MANVVLVVLVVLVVYSVVYTLRHHGHGIVARRGMSIGADLGTLSDKPRVRVQAVTTAGPDRVRLVLTPETAPADVLDLVVELREDEFGFELLHQWRRSEALVALVMPPGSRLVRLRSIDDLQPLTLSLADQR